MSMLLNIFGVAQVALAPSMIVQLYEGFLDTVYVRKRAGKARFLASYAQRNLKEQAISAEPQTRTNCSRLSVPFQIAIQQHHLQRVGQVLVFLKDPHDSPFEILV